MCTLRFAQYDRGVSRSSGLVFVRSAIFRIGVRVAAPSITVASSFYLLLVHVVIVCTLFAQASMLPLLRRPSLKELLRPTREAMVSKMDLSHKRVMRDGGVLRIQPLQVWTFAPSWYQSRAVDMWLLDGCDVVCTIVTHPNKSPNGLGTCRVKVLTPLRLQTQS